MRFLLIHYSRASQINHHLQIFVRFMLRISAFNRRANAEEVARRLPELKWRAGVAASRQSAANFSFFKMAAFCRKPLRDSAPSQINHWQNVRRSDI